MWTLEFGFGWNWVDGNNAITEDYHSETVYFTHSDPNDPKIPYPIQTLRGLNPKIKILCQITVVSLAENRLPHDDPWWQHDGTNLIAAPGGGFKLDLASNTNGLRTHVANQARAIMQTGQFDGIMLDSITQVPTSVRTALLTEVRNAVGGNALLIVNANASEIQQSALAQVNGVFMESGKIETGNGYPTWQMVKHALDTNEIYTRTPRINCLQDWYSDGPATAADLKRMRSITCLSLTHSNGYVNFGRDVYYWYDPFWSGHSLGVPIGTHYPASSFADRRDFQNGSAIWNASLGADVATVTFLQTRKSLATGAVGQTFTVGPSDGDIFLINY